MDEDNGGERMFKNWSLRERLVVALVMCCGLIGGFGCATMLTLSQPSENSTTKAGGPALRDTIMALGIPDAKMAEHMHDAQAVAFLGKQKTYLLVSGGDLILGMSRSLDPDKLSVKADNPELKMRDNEVWGEITFTYDWDGQGPNAAVLQQTLERLGFMRYTKDQYIAYIQVKGAVYPALDLQYPGFQALKHPRDLVFYAPDVTETTPNLQKFALLPVAIAVDVVTSPIQLGVLVIGLASQH